MTPVTPNFPVLKLPYLAVKNAIITMEVSDMIYLAVCSKKIQRLIRSVFSKSNEMDIKIELGDFTMKISGAISFELAHKRFFPSGEIITLQNRSFSPVSNMQLKDWFDLIMYTFRIENGVKLDLWSFHPSFADILRGQVITILRLLLDHGTSVVSALKEYVPTKELHLILLRRPDKEMPFLLNIFSRKFDYIGFNFKVSLEELYSLNATTIFITRLSFTDFNEFLKNWVNGGNPHLRKLEASVYCFDKTKKYLADYLSGIDISSFKYVEEGKFSCETFNIQKADGTTAEVRNTGNMFVTQFTVTPKSD